MSTVVITPESGAVHATPRRSDGRCVGFAAGGMVDRLHGPMIERTHRLGSGQARGAPRTGSLGPGIRVHEGSRTIEGHAPHA
jgi:hypothetical protein